jgi:hypothetical protein
VPSEFANFCDQSSTIRSMESRLRAVTTEGRIGFYTPRNINSTEGLNSRGVNIT